MVVKLTALHTVALARLLEEKFGAERLKNLKQELVALTNVMSA
jgi:hypothetical protein